MSVLSARPLLLAKRPPLPSTHFVPRGPAREDALAAHIAVIAAPDPVTPDTDAAEAIHASLAAAIARAQTPAALIGAALGVIAAAFGFPFAAAYVVSPERASVLVQTNAVGLPDDFREAIRLLPLSDFAEIADMPYSGDRTPSYGDFFAPVASQYGLRSWLIASLSDPQTLTVRGALLLGSPDSGRLATAEAAALLSRALTISEELADRFPLF